MRDPAAGNDQAPATANSKPEPSLLEQVYQLEDRINAGQADAIWARWEMGKLLSARKNGKKQLPNGLMSALKPAIGRGASDIRHRIQFYERYPTKAQVSMAVETYQTWIQIKRAMAEESREQRGPERVER
jgi:hypothetical protein